MNKEEPKLSYGYVTVTGGDNLKIYKGNVSIKTDETLYIEKLQQENKQLEQRIDKAVEYMEHYIEVEENDAVICEFKYVLKILKGDK